MTPDETAAGNQETDPGEAADPEAETGPEPAFEADRDAVATWPAMARRESDMSIPAVEYDLFGSITGGLAPSDDESLASP